MMMIIFSRAPLLPPPPPPPPAEAECARSQPLCQSMEEALTSLHERAVACARPWRGGEGNGGHAGTRDAKTAELQQELEKARVQIVELQRKLEEGAAVIAGAQCGPRPTHSAYDRACSREGACCQRHSAGTLLGAMTPSKGASTCLR